jgi:hypothetical protein
MSILEEPMRALNERVERRFYPRVSPSVPINIAFDKNNQGMLVNIGENGLLLSTRAGLPRNFVCRVSIRLDGLPKAIEVNVRVVWATESTKRAGIQMLDLSEYDREQIRKWAAREHLRDANVETSVSREETSVPQEQTRQRSAIAEAPGKLTRAVGVCSPQVGTHANTLNELGGGSRTQIDSVLNVPINEAPAGEVRQGVTARESRRNHASSRWLARLMWTAVIAFPVGLGLLLWPDDPVRNVLHRLGEAKAERTSASAIDDNYGAKPVQDDEMSVPVARPEKASRGNAPAATLGGINSRKSLFDGRAAGEAGQRSNTGGADVLDSDAQIQNVPDGKDDPGGKTDKTSSGAAEQSSTLGSLATSVSQATENGSGNTLRANPEKEEIWHLPIASSSARSNLPFNVPLVSSSNAPPSTASRAKSPADGPSSVERSGTYTDLPEGRVTEITPPKSHKESFVNLPGERVFESPSMTMHIQRLVLVPGRHKWLPWPWKGNSKGVVLGELISRVDPETSHLRSESGSGVSVRAIVDRDGHIENVVPVSGSTMLVPSVVWAVGQWRYQPTFLDDKPVKTETYILVEFHPAAGVPQ